MSIHVDPHVFTIVVSVDVVLLIRWALDGFKRIKDQISTQRLGHCRTMVTADAVGGGDGMGWPDNPVTKECDECLGRPGGMSALGLHLARRDA